MSKTTAQKLFIRPGSTVCVDDRWSAPRFRPLLPSEAAFTGGKGKEPA